MTLPWTHFDYMKIAGAVFPSRVRLYCVNLNGQCDGKCNSFWLFVACRMWPFNHNPL